MGLSNPLVVSTERFSELHSGAGQHKGHKGHKGHRGHEDTKDTKAKPNLGFLCVDGVHCVGTLLRSRFRAVFRASRPGTLRSTEIRCRRAESTRSVRL